MIVEMEEYGINSPVAFAAGLPAKRAGGLHYSGESAKMKSKSSGRNALCW
jgi:hypothetical protein